MRARASPEKRRWGIILADLAGHVADALSAEGMGAPTNLLDALVESFNDEVARPSSERRGERGGAQQS